MVVLEANVVGREKTTEDVGLAEHDTKDAQELVQRVCLHQS
jgi:hypothetical protein